MSPLWSLYAGACGALVILVAAVTFATLGWAYRTELAAWLTRHPVDLDTADRPQWSEAEARAYHPAGKGLPANPGKSLCEGCFVWHPDAHLSFGAFGVDPSGLLESWECPTCGWRNVVRASGRPVRGDVR